MKMPRVLLLILIVAGGSIEPSMLAGTPANAPWQTAVIVPEPLSVAGVARPVVSLAGTWKVTTTPPVNYWTDSVDPSAWADIRVPAEASRAGVPYRTRSYVYRRRFAIPADFASHRVYLRFEGVTGTARVWVNGTELEGHHGGFTIWNREITALVKPGESASIAVSVEEPTKETSTNTYTGGIIRDVKLLALPTNHVTRLHVDTDLDAHFRDAKLRIWIAASLNPAASAMAELTLVAPDGHTVALTPSNIQLSHDRPESQVEIPISNVATWEAEHPRLYHLRARILVDGRECQTLAREVGFREITVRGRISRQARREPWRCPPATGRTAMSSTWRFEGRTACRSIGIASR